MKTQSVLNWLVPLIAVLAIIMSTAGLFTQGGNGPFTFTTIHGNTVEMYGYGLYRNDSAFVASLLRGTDAITVFVSVPVLLISYWFYRRGSFRGNIFMTGMLTYFLYVGFTYTFSVVFNSMFLVYVALFSASLFATITAFATFDIHVLANKVSIGFPHRGMAIFMFVAGLGTFMLWLSELIGPIRSGQAPVNLGPYATMFTHGFDTAVITPAAVLTGILLLQRKPLGYLLAAPLLILCTNIGVVVIAQTISQSVAGIVFPIQVYIGMVGSWVSMGAFAVVLTIKFFRNIQDSRLPQKTILKMGAVS